ncbi:hypothetical protein [Desulfoplanes sp.]
MKHLPATLHQVHPRFDLQAYMFLAQTPTLTPQRILEMTSVWERWHPLLKAYTFGKTKGYLLVHLDHAVEIEMEELWKNSQEEAFLREALAQSMIMGTLRLFLPELDTRGCAPLPEPNKILKRSLAKVGITLNNQGGLGYKYATLTFLPCPSGCDKCFLRRTCPKKLGIGAQQTYSTAGRFPTQ